VILKGAQRAGALQLARHLQRDDENDHVEVHELRGFAATTLTGALHEAAAVAKGTRCRQHLFSLSLNPPETETVPVQVFEQAVERIEEKLGLSGQPRAIVFHEKEGRRHAHCVWSRINVETMTAINLPHFKRKLQDVGKQLFLEHGWQLPDGFLGQARDPRTFTRAEWQQAKRTGQDPQALKAMFQECWAAAPDGDTLRRHLEERGFLLARGDRRGVVALDYRGEVYALAKWAGVKAKEVKARMGDPGALPDLPAARRTMSERMTPVVERYLSEAQQAMKTGMASLALKKAQLRDRQREERRRLNEHQARRAEEESRQRAARFRKGFGGLWDWVTGKSRKTRAENEAEATAAAQRDREEREAKVAAHLAERRRLQDQFRSARARHHEEVARLREDVAHYLELGGRERPGNEQEMDARPRVSRKAPERGPDLER